MVGNGELQCVCLGNLTLVQHHEPIPPVGPLWILSSGDELMKMIINFIINSIIVIVNHFFKCLQLWLEVLYYFLRRCT
jgi:hypothetical protein